MVETTIPRPQAPPVPFPAGANQAALNSGQSGRCFSVGPLADAGRMAFERLDATVRLAVTYLLPKEDAAALPAQISQAVAGLPRLHLEVIGPHLYHVPGRSVNNAYVVDVLVERIPYVFASREQFWDYLRQVRKYC